MRPGLALLLALAVVGCGDDGEDVSWRDGQRGPTFIYRHVLRFTPRG